MEGFSTLEEKALLSRIAGGDEKAFTQLFERYSDVAYGFAIFYTKTAETAEEVVQEIFLKLWLKREKLRDIESFPDHLFIITRNHVIDFLRKHLREKKIPAAAEAILQGSVFHARAAADLQGIRGDGGKGGGLASATTADYLPASAE